MNIPQKLIKIGISSCLIGNRVRYDGNHKDTPLIRQILNSDYQLLPFCPEVDIGLGVPREKIQLVQRNDGIHCVDEPTGKIDYTVPLTNSCDRQFNWLKSLSGYIFKTKSPSCGITKVRTICDGEVSLQGPGILSDVFSNFYPIYL